MTETELVKEIGRYQTRVVHMTDTLKGCRDQLRESAKQHRLAGDGKGHGSMCDIHADKADSTIATDGWDS